MCPVNGSIQCAMGMGLSKCPGNGTIQSALGMGLANVPWEWDYPMSPRNGNVPWEWD